MRVRALRWSVGVMAGVLTTSAAVGCGGPEGPPPEAGAAVTAFARAWSAGTWDRTVAADTVESATRILAEVGDELAIQRTTVTPRGRLTCLDDDAAAALQAPGGVCRRTLEVSHELAGLGTWTYTTTVEVREDANGRWAAWWTPSTFHPKLTEGTLLQRQRALPPRASILDRDGQPLTQDGPVVRVGVRPDRVDPKVTYDKLSAALGVGLGDLPERVRAAEPTAFVHALTLRAASYDEIAGYLDEIPGVVTRKTTMSLAPSSSYARGVLGVVGAPTDEALDDAGPLALDTDFVGLSGLQRAFEPRLAGRPGGSVRLVQAYSGELIADLATFPAQPGEPLRTTLDPLVQDAAEAVVADQTKPTSIVAVRASTGEILAAANGPGVTSYNRAFVGQYPPGSTFKVVSLAALLESGVRLDDQVTCQAETNVGGKRFTNANNASRPPGPLVDAFAHSCNTTIVERAMRLDDAALTAMAQRFGIGATWDIGLPAYSGSVPPPRDLVDRAATMIGQGRVLVSPLGMALVAATVATGQARTPTLLPDLAPGEPVGEKLPASLQADLRRAMRAVVERGSARALDLLGDPVHAKTGTAEYGTQTPPRTHAWMIGFRGDIAFAVVVDDGGAGGRDAGPVARRFLEEARFAD